MPKVSTGIDEETYQALLVDAARYLRPAERHIAALLRQALGLPVPLPPPTSPESLASPAESPKS